MLGPCHLTYPSPSFCRAELSSFCEWDAEKLLHFITSKVKLKNILNLWDLNEFDKIKYIILLLLHIMFLFMAELAINPVLFPLQIASSFIPKAYFLLLLQVSLLSLLHIHTHTFSVSPSLSVSHAPHLSTNQKYPAYKMVCLVSSLMLILSW